MAPLFSSIPMPDVVKIQEPKDSTEKSAKKRKRENEQDGTPVIMEDPVKKSKKRKSDGAAVTTPGTEQTSALSTAGSIVEEKSEKKRKHEKKRKAASEEPGQDAPMVEHSATSPQKEMKDGSIVDVEGAQPGVEQVKPTKKKRKPKLDQLPNGNKEASAEPAVAAGPSKAQQRSRVQGGASHEASLTDDQRLHTYSPFIHQTETFYLALSPCANDFPLEGLVAEHISPLLLTYHPPLRGVVLKYSNARLSETPDGQSKDGDGVVLSKAIDEYAVTFVYLTVDLVIFAPTKDSWLEGYVNLQNESLLGLVCYNYFNAAIERQRLPKDWRWVDDASRGNTRVAKGGHGYWVDDSGGRVDGKVVFRVKDFDAAAGGDSGAGSINILGTLLSVEEDRQLDHNGRQRSVGKGLRK